MAERLTVCIDSHLLDNGEMVKEYSLNNNIKLNQFSVMDIPNAVYDKLGKLEDILERYNIESVENLDSILEKYFSDTWITVTPKITKNWELICDIMASDELNRNFELGVTRDRDTWKRACELACETMTKLGGDDCCGCRLNKEMCKICENKKGLIDYFYQQAKTEGNDESNNQKILYIR